MDRAGILSSPVQSPAGNAGLFRSLRTPDKQSKQAVPTNVLSIAQSCYMTLCNSDGLMSREAIPQLLDQLSLSIAGCEDVIKKVSGTETHLTRDQAMAIVGLIHGGQALAANNSTNSLATSTSSRAPFKRVLTKNRSYLETGSLSYDEAVVDYLSKLDQHRRKCESDGRYQEASAAAKRLAELKTAQVERLRQELVVNQSRELEEVHRVFQEESIKFSEQWDQRLHEYEDTFEKAVDDLQTLQREQLLEYEEDLMKKRPTKPKPSKEYLNQKRIEQSMARSGQYSSAEQVREAADELYTLELTQTQQAFDAGQKFKLAKFAARQKQELEALLQRGARGRDELQLRRVAETERRLYRFRNVITELESLHRLEVVQLEAFLDNQIQAGKAAPMKDEGAFRRRREAIYSTTL